MNIPNNLKYTESHEWVRVEGNQAVVGITDFAQHQLTDVVFVELPEVGREVAAGDSCCVVESTKVAADVYAPVAGKVASVNTDLDTNPELVNDSPFEKGWLFRLELADPSEVEGLKSPKEYEALLV